MQHQSLENLQINDKFEYNKHIFFEKEQYRLKEYSLNFLFFW